MTIKEEFTKFIQNKINNSNADYIDIVSGDIHREVGGYPAPNHRMPSVCDAMYDLMKDNDKILSAPKSGKGATLKIRYYK